MPHSTVQAQSPIAIVGGGPAGALAASLLAAGGQRVVVFDEKLAWEKPCGGGLTHKALTQYPFLNDNRGQHPRALIRDCELISPSGRRVRFHLRHPIAIFPRVELNGMLLERAARAGAELRRERVVSISGETGDWRVATASGEYRAWYLVLAAGARIPFRGQFAPPIAADDLMVTAGYFIPGQSALLQIQFLDGIAGYIWIFPRPDHCSAGIAGRMGEVSTAEVRRILERWLAKNGFQLDGAKFYSHILPALRPKTLESLAVNGEGWALLGDSAGLVDPITGEGLYYALRSGELCAQAVLAGRPREYPARLNEEILPELKRAARVSRRFYSGKVFEESVLERMVAFSQQSATFRDLMCDLFAGIQGYRDLRARLYRTLPAMMTEGLASTLRTPLGGGWAADPFAE